MKPFMRWIFLAAAFIQVAWFCKDARDWCLWLPGLTICAAGLLMDRRSHLCGNTLVWIVCLVLYVIAPASQWDNGYFQGPISVVGIHFPDAIIMRTIALTDVFMGALLAMQLIMRRLYANQHMAIGYADIRLSPAVLSPVVHPRASKVSAEASPQVDTAVEPTSNMEDNQVFILLDDPGEFQYIPAVEDDAPSAEPQVEDREMPLPAALGDPVSAILNSPFVALMMLLISVGVPTAMYLMVGNLDFVTNGREFALSAFADSALGTFINSFTQDLLVVLTLLAIERYGARRNRDNLMLLAIVVVCTLIMINPFNTARYQVGAVLIMAVLFSCRGRLPMALTYAGIAIYMYAIMPLMNLLRYGLAGIQGQKVAYGIDFNTLDYDCFSMFAFAVYRTAIGDFAYGKFMVSSVLFFLPRSWWPGKPRPSSSDLGQYLMQHHSGWFDNLSCPPMGDGYMDFGIAGVICMGALFGYLIECSDQVIDCWSQSTFIRRGMAAAFVAFIPILLRGSLGAVMGFVIAPVVILIILWVSARSFHRLQEEAEPRLAWKMR